MTLAARDSAGDLRELVARGAQLHHHGRLDEAAEIYSQVLARSPRDFDATHLLGLIALQQGRYHQAQQLIRSAVAIQTDDATALGNLGVSYLRDGQLEIASEWLAIALSIQPDSAPALLGAGTALHGLARYRDAIPLLQAAYASEPNSQATCKLLGESFLSCGDAAQAVNVLEEATGANPEDGDAWALLGDALTAAGDGTRAAECADRAAALGGRAKRRPGAAAAVPVPPRMIADFAFILLANRLHEQAIDQLRRLVAMEPMNLRARWTIAVAHIKPICNDLADIKATRKQFADAMDEVASWYECNPGINTAHDAVGAIQPFFLAYQECSNRELLRRYGQLCARWMATLPTTTLEMGRRSAERLVRIGIASVQIRDHSVWNAITKGWVFNIDRTKFEVFIFHIDGKPDRETALARQAVKGFEDRPTTLREWIEAITSADLDVLIYPAIGMDSLIQQLAALRLAPVQAAAWGHPETTGLPTIDLYLSAEGLEPPNGADNYTEKLVRLPNLGVFVEPMSVEGSGPESANLNLSRSESLLICPGAPFKYSPLFDDIWPQIAMRLRRGLFRRTTAGRLIFFRSEIKVLDRLLETRLRAAFARAGLDFDAHVNIIAHLDRSQFFTLLRRSALMLDTPGFSGFNTALQAIACDLPVLAYEGEFMRGRLASAVIRRLDLPELVATSKQEYIEKAAELILDPKKLEALRQRLSERRKILYSDMEPVRALERELVLEIGRKGGNSAP